MAGHAGRPRRSGWLAVIALVILALALAAAGGYVIGITVLS